MRQKRSIFRLVFALMSLITCHHVLAETHYRSHISFGGHGGVTLSNMSFSPGVPQTWPIGMTIGGQVRYAEEKLCGVIAELNLTQRGWEETFKHNETLHYRRTINYLTLPVMTHINFGSNRCRCFINLGPEFSYMVGESISSNFNYENPGSGFPANRRKNQMSMEIKNKFDYGITAGLGCEFWIRPRHSIYIEGRYYFGLGNIYSASKADEFSASRCTNISVTFGYNFRIK